MIPSTIPFSAVNLGDRARTEYQGIDELADSISLTGLIQPIVIEPTGDDEVYILRAGGRRFHALKELGVETLYHAVSSNPTQPGFLFANVASDILQGLMIELAENHDRADMPWRDDLKLLVKAYKLWETNQHLLGLPALQRQFGSICGVGYMDMKCALLIHDDVLEYPDRYESCDSIRQAYAEFLKITAEYLTKKQAALSIIQQPLRTKENSASVKVPVEPAQIDDALRDICIPLTESVLHDDGLDYLHACADDTFDHIVTDPDYAISVDRLSSNSATAEEGIAQLSVEESLADLQKFLTVAYRVTKGFCVFFYDLEHHEKLQRMATDAGWCAQRWPLIWIKPDFRSNAAPTNNFCKNFEVAMVLRKPRATLIRAQTVSSFTAPCIPTQQQFGHPFAKPIDLWRWIYSAIAIKGQRVCDPFAGRGTAPYAAVVNGLRPVAIEKQERHYHDLLVNMQGAYRHLLGSNISFK